jgi:hypothetical protein
VKKTEAIMEILAAYDSTHSFRDAAELTGSSHHTVARYVRARDARIGLATGGGFGRGCRSQVCGCSGTTPTGHWSKGARRGCGAPGWPGAASASSCRLATRRYRRSSPVSTARFGDSEVSRRPDPPDTGR